MKQILVLAAHPDDEILECGGTIAKMVRSGLYEAHAVIVCEGESLRYDGQDVNQDAARQRADGIIGYRDSVCLGFPDQRLDKFSLVEVNQKIEEICDRLRPQIVFTHSCADLNRDHRIVSESAQVALRPGAEYVEAVLTFCNQGTRLAGAEAFAPNVWVDIEETLSVKTEAFSQYASEIRPFPHLRSIEGIEAAARYCGTLCNRRAAECFTLIRSIF